MGKSGEIRGVQFAPRFWGCLEGSVYMGKLGEIRGVSSRA